MLPYLSRGARLQGHIGHLQNICPNYRLLIGLTCIVHKYPALAITLDEHIANFIHFDFESIANGLFDDLYFRITHGIIETI